MKQINYLHFITKYTLHAFFYYKKHENAEKYNLNYVNVSIKQFIIQNVLPISV